MVPVTGFRWLSGEDSLRVYRRPSGYTAPFCRVCGSTAPWVSEEYGAVFVPCGLFDEPFDRAYDFHVFAGSKADWWQISDSRHQFESFPPGMESKAEGSG